jgi:hypothetical protein
MATIDAAFTPEEVAQRPFAVETGYSEWGDLAGHIVSRVGVQEVPYETGARNLIDQGKIDRALSMGMEVCRETCEAGFASRDVPALVMPRPHDMAESVLGDSFHSFEQSLYQSLGADEAVITAHGGLSRVIPRIAEISYLWGRHDEQIGLHETPPTVVRDDNLISIRPQGINQRVQAAMRDIGEIFEPPHRSKRQQLLAKLSERYHARLYVEERLSIDSMARPVEAAIATALIDLASEAPETED